jgi:trigger factor
LECEFKSYKIKNKPKSVVQFDVVVPWKEIEGKLDNIFKDIRKQVRLDGFRKGKAPMDIIEEKYTREARAELVRINVPEILTDIFEKEEINPVTTPQIESTPNLTSIRRRVILPIKI